MKKITLLCVEADREQTLEALRDIGVLHINDIEAAPGERLETARTRLKHLRRILEKIPKNTVAESSGKPVMKVVSEIQKVLEYKKLLETTKASQQRALERLVPFGNFDPDSIRALADKGIFFRLFTIGSKAKLPSIKNGMVKELSSNKNSRYFAVISKQKIKIVAQEITLPTRSPKTLENELVKTKNALEECEQDLFRLSGDYQAITQLIDEEEDKVRFLEVHAGMVLQEHIACLQGFCPTHCVSSIRKEAAKNGWGLLIAEPDPGEEVPTLIQNPKLIQPIETIFKLIGIVPGYREVDISPVFLTALSLFFAMLVGDAGYGLIFLGLTMLLRCFKPKAPIQPFAFMYIMSIATIIWGMVTGNYFGYFGPDRPLPILLKALTIPWLTDADLKDKHIMLLCFFVGAIHLTIAHGWNGLRLINSSRALAQFGWILSTWVMFFAAKTMVLGDPFPKMMLYVLSAAILLIALFMTPFRKFKSEWFNHAILPLNIIGNFTDVVSYIRLFAVGSSSYAIAKAFNDLLLDGGFNNFWVGLISSLFLFAGHVLNLALCGLGILVHGIRLNTLEFSSHIGMQWSGFDYQPFERKTRLSKELTVK